MKIGSPKETFAGEARVAMTPDSALQLQKLGYDCLIETGLSLPQGWQPIQAKQGQITAKQDRDQFTFSVDAIGSGVYRMRKP